MKKIFLSLVIGLISFSFMNCSSDDVDEYVENTENCAVTIIEDAIIKNHISYYKPNYTKSTFTVYLSYDLNTYDFYKNNNYKNSNYRNNIKSDLENYLNISLTDDGYQRGSGSVVINNLGWVNIVKLKFSGKLYDDKINIICDPNASDEIYVEINCKHNHKNKKLK